MAYLAEIQLAVKGAKQLKDLSNTIEATSKKVDRLARDIQTLSEGGIPRTINNLRSIVRQAADAFDAVALNTKEASDAARDYYQANKTLNNALRERVKLLNDIQTAERGTVLANIKASQAARTASNFGLFSAGVESTAAVQKSIRRNRQKTARLPKAAIEATPLMLPAFQERGLQLLDDAVKLNTSQLNLERALNGERARGARYLEKQTAEEARQVQLGILGQRTNRLPGVGAAAPGQFPVSGPINLGGGRGQTMLPGSQAAARSALGAGIKGRLPGAISGGIIGGAFPLLFGQGGGAAAGGLAGGVIGGLFGPGGSFAGSLLGTLLGDIASQGQKIKQLGTDIGFSAQQADVLASSFKKVNTDIEKFTGVVQNIRGLGLVLEDQAELIRITTALTEKYGGQFDKVGNAITSALESGKVSQSTLNQLTSQGINVQQALADKLGVSRDRLLEMAKKGEISVQDLINTLVDLGNKGTTAAAKPASGFALLSKATKDLGSALGDLGSAIVKALKPALDWLSGALAGIIGLATQAIQSIANMLSGGTAETVLANARARRRLRLETGAPEKGNLTVKQQERLRQLEKEEQASMVKPKPLRKIDVTGLGQAAPTGGQTKKERESRVPELQIEVQLAEKLAALNLRIAEAKDNGNKAVEHALEMEKILEERSAAISKIKLQDIPAAEKDLQIRLATVQADEKLRNIIIEKNKVSKEAADAAQKVLDTSKKEIETIQKKRDKEKEYAQLIKDGVLPANAENYLQTKELVKSAIESAEAAIVEAEARGASADKVKELRENLDKIRKQGQSEIDNAKTTKPGATIEDAITKARGELNELIDAENQVIAGAKAIGSAFRDAFTGLVSGAMTGQEALAAFFKGVGDHFMDMAAQMIAKLIEIWILETALGFITGSIGGSGGGGGDPGGKAVATGAPIEVAAAGAYWPGGFQAFADGGIVTRPTMGLVGEGGEAEYIIPASKMRGAMNRYAAGARGSAVIPAGDGGDGGTATMVAAPGAIDVRYTVERINSVDYVTADQFQQGMRQAAQQGAAQGEQRTLRRLQMSTSTRKRLGM